VARWQEGNCLLAVLPLCPFASFLSFFVGPCTRQTFRIFYIFAVALRARRCFIKFAAGVAILTINFSMIFVQSYSGNAVIKVFGTPTAVTNSACCFKFAEFALRYMAFITIQLQVILFQRPASSLTMVESLLLYGVCMALLAIVFEGVTEDT
jgi:hypothetical protein